MRARSATMLPAGFRRTLQVYAAQRSADADAALAEHAALENSLRGILRAVRAEGPHNHADQLSGRIEERVRAHPNLQTIGPPLLSVAGPVCLQSSTGLRSACGRCRAFMTSQALIVDASGRADRPPSHLPARR